jgi:poly-gamma-glutamate capsule biosynthesis protein CapA/YwtB (metallophosphatase superfamily)
MFICVPTLLLAEEIVINAVGDIMLAGRWASIIKKQGYDTSFSATTPEFAKGDINLANLESPIARNGVEFTAKKFRFRAEPELAPALRKAGFQLVTLANNHSMDFGGQALAETMINLEAAGIAWIGAGKNLAEARKMALYTIKGKKIAFLSYSLTQPIEFFAGQERPGTAPGYEKPVVADVASARRQADYVIVSFHWGKEGSGTVQSYQRSAAHRAIEAGADVIIGHHPHVLQGVERYKGGIIFYSLGNFAFASNSQTSAVAALVRLRLNGAAREAEILPLDVLNSRVRFQPQLLSGKRADNVISQLNSMSIPFKTTIENRDGRYYVSF